LSDERLEHGPLQTSANLSDGQEWGDYNGLSVLGEKVLYVWTDNRDGPPNAKDVFAGSAENVAAGPNFSLGGADLSQAVCAPGDLDDIDLEIGQIQDFSSPVSLNLVGLPGGFSGSISPNVVTPAGTATASVSVGSVAAGDYGFSIVGSASGVDNRELSVAVEVFDSAPAAPSLTAPVNGAGDQSLAPLFTWDAVPQAASYTLEIAEDPAFASITYTVTVDEPQHQLPVNLGTEQTFYWRVRTENLCGGSGDSATFSFTTAALICVTPNIAIPDNSPQGLGSPLALNEAGNLLGLDVSVRITHTWVGDLRIGLQHVDTGTTVLLMDRPGQDGSGFGCDGDDINVTFSDGAVDPIEDECGAGIPSLDGTFTPQVPLAAFAGESLAGNWVLFVSDNPGQDTGTLNEWCLIPATDVVVEDADGDGVKDSSDNCLDVPNADQTDGDSDGIGNACDADLNNDCTVNFTDLELLKQVFFTNDAVGDLNGNGTVDFEDLGLMKAAFFGAPGPAADPNVCSAR